MDKVEEMANLDKHENVVERLTLGQVNIVGPDFWNEHPFILEDK